MSNLQRCLLVARNELDETRESLKSENRQTYVMKREMRELHNTIGITRDGLYKAKSTIQQMEHESQEKTRSSCQDLQTKLDKMVGENGHLRHHVGDLVGSSVDNIQVLQLAVDN